jgi:hypothetical protein
MLRVLTPRGHALRHLPQNLQRYTDINISFSMPLRAFRMSLHKLYSVDADAVHAEAQVPQLIHQSTEGSFFLTKSKIRRLPAS